MSDSDHPTLREFIERILDEREKTLNLVAANLERRLAGLNELRSDVIKDREGFLERKVYEVSKQIIETRLTKLENAQARIIGVGLAIVTCATLLGIFIGLKMK